MGEIIQFKRPFDMGVALTEVQALKRTLEQTYRIDHDDWARLFLAEIMMHVTARGDNLQEYFVTLAEGIVQDNVTVTDKLMESL